MNPAVIGASIPIVAIVFGIGIGALAMWAEHKRKSQLMDQLHRERIVALEKGVEPPALPPGLVGFQNSRPSATPRALWPKAMRNGLMLLFGGIVLYFAIYNAGGEPGAAFALIPAAIGVANLIYAAVLWSQEKDEPPKV
jgi:hypothetical protein